MNKMSLSDINEIGLPLFASHAVSYYNSPRNLKGCVVNVNIETLDLLAY